MDEDIFGGEKFVENFSKLPLEKYDVILDMIKQANRNLLNAPSEEAKRIICEKLYRNIINVVNNF